jgi:hypothetical protein
MVPPYGFGIGDFIAGIQLIRAIVIAINGSHGAAKEFRDLMSELRSFETGLIHIRGYVINKVTVDQDNSRNPDADILQIISDCRAKIDDILDQVDRYQKRLGPAHKLYPSRFKDSIAKIKFHLFKMEDVGSWQRSLYMHTSSITLILTAQFT